MNFFYQSILSQCCGTSGTYGIFMSIYSTTVTGLHLILMIVFTSLAIHNVRKGQLRIQPNVNQGNRIKKKIYN